MVSFGCWGRIQFVSSKASFTVLNRKWQTEGKNPNFHSCLTHASLVKANTSQQDCLKARTHRDEYRRTLFVSVFQRVFCVHTQAIFADDEPSEHANSFPDIRWRLMWNRNTPVHKVVLSNLKRFWHWLVSQKKRASIHALVKIIQICHKVICVQTPTRPAALHSSCLASSLSSYFFPAV